ncbi:hypothetical protein [Chitinolyticbacter meiyuanensis]|nr:hypothetical protein [Chitinolyticbacter meiyuanensis]
MARRLVGIWLLAIMATVSGVLWSSSTPDPQQTARSETPQRG